MSEPLDTTPCNRPSANSTNGTFANLRGRAGGTTRAALDSSQPDNTPSPLQPKGFPRRTGGTKTTVLTVTDRPVRAQGQPDRQAGKAGECVGGTKASERASGRAGGGQAARTWVGALCERPM